MVGRWSLRSSSWDGRYARLRKVDQWPLAWPCNLNYMITNEATERVRGWFSGRLPQEWQAEPASITIDREEITVMLTLPDVELAGTPSDAEADEARAGRAKAFREETRGKRMEIDS